MVLSGTGVGLKCTSILSGVDDVLNAIQIRRDTCERCVGPITCLQSPLSSIQCFRRVGYPHIKFRKKPVGDDVWEGDNMR
jgi:hypothetical protein